MHLRDVDGGPVAGGGAHRIAYKPNHVNAALIKTSGPQPERAERAQQGDSREGRTGRAGNLSKTP